MKESNAVRPPGMLLRREVTAAFPEIDRLCGELRTGVLADFPPRERFAVELLLREALTNAVRHGTGAGGLVRCEIEWIGNGVAIRVCDSGSGFDWRKSEHLTCDSRAESGRGIQILRQYSNALRFNESGNSVEVIRVISQGRT
jgi:anti-sigma regulatory factor (Ser/Thr protein kinase)